MAKMYVVMAAVDFDHDGKSRKRGQIFEMSQPDYDVWGGFCKIVGRELLKIDKPVKAPERKVAHGTVKRGTGNARTTKVVRGNSRDA